MLLSSVRTSRRASNCIAWICRRCQSTATGPARTRFAPSPTGELHLGSLRTALYNYLWAKRTKGQFILRIEDTDQKRLDHRAEASLFDNLNWAGLTVDEGPKSIGPDGPYRQSERLDVYRQHIQTLLDNGSAYRCFCSVDRLTALRKELRKNGETGTYDRKCFAVSKAESEERAAASEPHTIRLRSPKTRPLVKDVIHGTVDFSKAKQEFSFDDVILIKGDGFPSYHFANVVDDHLMRITHVIRGEEWLVSTPIHLAIYEAFGWTPPVFAHVPLLASVGGAKLSKRHGDVSVESYRKEGYLPEAMLNYLALMGWNANIAQGETEVMTLDELAARFSLNQITKGATIVTPEKLQFLQKQHYNRLAASDAGMRRLLEQTQSELQKRFDRQFEDTYVMQVIDALKERIVNPLGLPELGIYFFALPDLASPEAVKFSRKFEQKSTVALAKALNEIRLQLSKIDDAHWTGTDFNLKIEKLFAELDFGVPNNLVMGAIRYAIAGSLSGAGVKPIMQIIGREETLSRFQKAIEHTTS